MTDVWNALTIAVSLAGGPQQATVEPIDNVLTVEWHRKQIRPADGAVIFSGGVVARYGPTELHSDKLTLYQSDTRKEGMAEGAVELIDPDGTAKATTLKFNWLKRTGHGDDVTVLINGLYLKATTLDVNPGEWILLNVEAAPDASKHPLFGVKTSRVVLRPGQGGTASSLHTQLFGRTVVVLPRYRFGTQGSNDSLSLPSFSYNNGFGIKWNSRYLVDDRSELSGGFQARKGNRPSAQIELTRSLLPRNEPETLMPPISDLAERFNYGYFDSLFVKRPSMEASTIGARRSSVTLDSSFNQGAAARFNDNLYSKPYELIFEEGRTTGGFGLFGNVRYQHIQEIYGPSDLRGLAMMSVLFPQVHLGGGLSTHVRVDGAGYAGKERFGWAQAQAGLTYNPNPHVRIGSAFVLGSQTGNPFFENDKLYSTRAFHGRIDLDFGSTKLSFLTKYDLDRRKWYDNEIGLSQVAGPINPFVIYREFPRSLTFGVKLRAEDVFERLRLRLEHRTPTRLDKP